LVGALAVAFALFSQPTLRVRYERDGRYPTDNILISPPVVSEITAKFWGTRRPSAPIQWAFPASLSENTRLHCIYWPDLSECAPYAISLTRPERPE
jgi:hypothetical protein